MKELDFDELDRAVNSLMTDVSKADTPATDEQQEKTLDLTPPPATTPSSAAPEPQASATAVPVSVTPPKITTPSAPLATRRGGRFMDVVHPSSDMKKPDQPRSASRQGITVAPRGAFEVPTTVKASSVDMPTDVPSTLAEQPKFQPTPVETHPAAVSEWPDPLEMADFKDKEPSSAPEPAVPVEAAEVSLPAESAETETDTTERSPLESPFLPDTKVEKRPLGSGTPQVEEPDHAALPNAEVEKTASDPNDQLPALPKDVESILPEEFHSELVAIESDANTVSNNPKTDDVLSEREKEEVASKKAAAEAALKSSEAESEAPVPTGPTSIPQQYREEPSTGDKESGAIYDTDAYHQPLAHPAKKKSGWLWVIWIVLILLVGGGAGAAMYFLGII